MPYLTDQRNFQTAHYTPGPDVTSPESVYFSSPPHPSAQASYDTTLQDQLPRLFTSPPQKPQPQQQPQYNLGQSVMSPETARMDGRKIAGSIRASQAATQSLAPSNGNRSGGSGFSSHSAHSAHSAGSSHVAPNPYSVQQNRPGNAATSTMFINSTPATASGAGSNPKKRARHSTSQSLSVPQPTYGAGNNQGRQNSAQSSSRPIAGVPAANTGQFPVRFDLISTSATYEDTDDSDESDDDADPTPVATSGRGGRGRPGRKGTLGREVEGARK